MSNVTVTFTLSNTGNASGAEVPQLYLGFPAAAAEPPRLLRDFAKVALSVGESQAVSFELSAQALSIWNEALAAWQLLPGLYSVDIGSSSRDLRLKGGIQVV